MIIVIRANAWDRGVIVVVGPRSLQTDSAPRPMSPSTSVAPKPPTRLLLVQNLKKLCKNGKRDSRRNLAEFLYWLALAQKPFKQP